MNVKRRFDRISRLLRVYYYTYCIDCKNDCTFTEYLQKLHEDENHVIDINCKDFIDGGW